MVTDTTVENIKESTTALSKKLNEPAELDAIVRSIVRARSQGKRYRFVINIVDDGPNGTPRAGIFSELNARLKTLTPRQPLYNESNPLDLEIIDLPNKL